jgi:hypothetical protein
LNCFSSRLSVRIQIFPSFPVIRSGHLKRHSEPRAQVDERRDGVWSMPDPNHHMKNGPGDTWSGTLYKLYFCLVFGESILSPPGFLFFLKGGGLLSIFLYMILHVHGRTSNTAKKKHNKTR